MAASLCQDDKNFESVLPTSEVAVWGYGVVLWSSRPPDFSGVRGGKVEQMDDIRVSRRSSPAGTRNVWDGGITVRGFRRTDQRLTITRVPVLIGK
jgi:hypothetical protein